MILFQNYSQDSKKIFWQKEPPWLPDLIFVLVWFFSVFIIFSPLIFYILIDFFSFSYPLSQLLFFPVLFLWLSPAFLVILKLLPQSLKKLGLYFFAFFFLAKFYFSFLDFIFSQGTLFIYKQTLVLIGIFFTSLFLTLFIVEFQKVGETIKNPFKNGFLKLSNWFSQEKNLILSILILSLFFILFYSSIAINRHESFFTHAFDLGILDQAIWKLSRFEVPENTIWGINNIFGHHFYLIIYSLAPLYWIWDDVKILLISQVIILTLGVVPLYFLCRLKKLSHYFVILIIFLYLIFPGLQSLILFDFHPISFFPLLFFSAIYFFEKKQWPFYFLFIFLLIITKEYIPIYLAFFGLFLFFKEKSLKIGAITFLIGLVSFFSIIGIFMPKLAGISYPYLGYYGDYRPAAGNSLQTIFSDFLNRPLTFLANLLKPATNPQNWITTVFYTSTVLPALIVSPLSIILFIPLFFEKVLSTNPHVRDLTKLQHIIVFLPFIILTLIYALKEKLGGWMEKMNISENKIRNAIITFSILMVFLFNYFHYLPFPKSLSSWKSLPRSQDTIQEFRELLSVVPSQAKVAANGYLVPHLTHRQKTYLIPVISDAEYIITTKNPQNSIYSGKEDKEIYALLNASSSFKTLRENSEGVVFKKTNKIYPELKEELINICIKATMKSPHHPAVQEFFLDNCRNQFSNNFPRK